MSYQKNPDEIGALWTKSNYMSGNIEIEGKQIRIVCFPNDRKREEKHPDWKILISRPKAEKPQYGFTDTAQKVKDVIADEINPKDIPF